MITALDGPAFAILCRLIVQERDLAQDLDREGLVTLSTKKTPMANPKIRILDQVQKQLHRYAIEFGATPGARRKVSVSMPAEPDPLAEWEARRDAVKETP